MKNKSDRKPMKIYIYIYIYKIILELIQITKQPNANLIKKITKKKTSKKKEKALA